MPEAAEIVHGLVGGIVVSWPPATAKRACSMLSDMVSPSSFAACGPSRASYMAFSAGVAGVLERGLVVELLDVVDLQARLRREVEEPGVAEDGRLVRQRLVEQGQLLRRQVLGLRRAR